MGADHPTMNLRRFEWDAWLADFKAAFGLCDPAQDVLNHIGTLQQGSKSITEYCTMFFELKGKLGPADANSEYIKDRFWKGLSAVAMEALVNMDFTTAEEARDILLCQESKLANIAAKNKGHWHRTGTSKPSSLAPILMSAATTVHIANPLVPKDPDAMDVDWAQWNVARKCFKCGKTGHLIAECPAWLASLKVAVWEAMDVERVGSGMEDSQLAAGFV